MKLEIFLMMVNRAMTFVIIKTIQSPMVSIQIICKAVQTILIHGRRMLHSLMFVLFAKRHFAT